MEDSKSRAEVSQRHKQRCSQSARAKQSVLGSTFVLLSATKNVKQRGGLKISKTLVKILKLSLPGSSLHKKSAPACVCVCVCACLCVGVSGRDERVSHKVVVSRGSPLISWSLTAALHD